MEEKIRLRIGTVLNDNRIDILSEDGDSLLHDLYRVIEQELDRAREEGRREVIHKLKEEIDMAEVSKFIDAHQDFFNSFGKSVLLKISKLNKKK